MWYFKYFANFNISKVVVDRCYIKFLVDFILRRFNFSFLDIWPSSSDTDLRDRVHTPAMGFRALTIYDVITILDQLYHHLILLSNVIGYLQSMFNS